jgi:hypothetical protein
MTNPIIDNNGHQRWYNNEKQYHREDGPAVILDNGYYMAWYKNGNFHRTDGPARTWHENIHMHEWFIDDIRYRDNKSFQRAAKLSDEDMNFIILKYGDVK